MSELSLMVPPLILIGLCILRHRSGQSSDNPGTDGTVSDCSGIAHIPVTIWSEMGEGCEHWLSAAVHRWYAHCPRQSKDCPETAQILLTLCSGKKNSHLACPKTVW